MVQIADQRESNGRRLCRRAAGGVFALLLGCVAGCAQAVAVASGSGSRQGPSPIRAATPVRVGSVRVLTRDGNGDELSLAINESGDFVVTWASD